MFVKDEISCGMAPLMKFELTLNISRDDNLAILLGSGPQRPMETNVRTFKVGILTRVVKNESKEKL